MDKRFVRLFQFIHQMQLGLQIQGQFADFIQKQGGAVGNLKAPQPFGMPDGAGPFLMAEKFAFDEVRRQCGAVHFYQGAILEALYP